MRYRAVPFVLAALLVFTSSFCYAELKIAVVVATKAIFESEEAKQKMSTLEETLSPQVQELETLRQEMTDLRDRLVKDEAVLSDDAKREQQKQLENMQIDLEFGLQRYRKAVQDGNERIISEITPKFNAVVQDLIELEGYDMVFNHNITNQFLLYVNQKHDITRKVTEGINNKSVVAPASDE